MKNKNKKNESQQKQQTPSPANSPSPAPLVPVPVGSQESIRASTHEVLSSVADKGLAGVSFTESDFEPLAKDLAVSASMPKETAAKMLFQGYEVIQSHIITGQKYVNLAETIRDNKIGPSQVTKVLLALGFHKVRISEVNRLATCAPELWSKYKLRELSLKKVLQIERGGAAVEQLDLSEDERKEAGLTDEDTGASSETLPKKTKTHAIRVALAVKALQALCFKEALKYETVKVYDKSQSGIVVTIKYVKPAAPASK